MVTVGSEIPVADRAKHLKLIADKFKNFVAIAWSTFYSIIAIIYRCKRVFQDARYQDTTLFV